MFAQVSLPLIGPAVGAGGLLVAMYVLSDFGTVALLRYRTFTTAIYNQFAGQIDREGAAILSLLLVALIVPVLVLERALNRRVRRASAGTQQRPPLRVALGRCRWPAFGLLSAVTAAALGFPLSVFLYLALRGAFAPTEIDRIWSVGADGVWVQAFNSLMVAGGAATLAVVLALAPAYLVVRYPSRWTRGLMAVSQTPYVLPGLVAGLGFVLLFNQGLPWIYGTVAALILGFAFRLLPQALTTVEAALRSVPAVTEQAGRVLGRTPLGVFRAITLPLATPGVAAGWALAFITAMKELPLAMLLRPPGFDVLAVRVWSASSESVYTQAAPPALLLVATTLVPLVWVLSREAAHQKATGDRRQGSERGVRSLASEV
jgi:iron(III) transport system permease protein